MRLNKHNILERMKNTFIEVLQIEMIESDDICTLDAIMPVTVDHTQTTGVLHGGATIALAETLAGVASNQICEIDEYCLGMQISANHVSSAKMGDRVIAKGSIIHKGRTTHVWNVDVTSEATGKLISTVRIVNAILKKK